MWQFLKEYISTPDTIGAIAPSSKHLAASMTKRTALQNMGQGRAYLPESWQQEKAEHDLYCD